MVDQLTKFFDRLYRYSDGFVEIRPLPGKQGFFPPDDVDAIQEYISHYRGSNIYFGIGSRDGKGGTAKNVIHIPCVWADVDFKTTSRRELYNRLNAFLFRPSMIVKSGGGAHLYWVLSEPATSAEFDQIVEVNHRIAAAIGGDQNAIDPARILRPPTTFYLKYKPPRPVELSVINRLEHDFQCFIDELPPVVTRHSTDGRHVKTSPPGWLAEALRGVPQGSRNATAAKIAGYFIDKLPRRDIASILLPWGGNCRPPMKEEELKKVIDSIYRYRKGKPNEEIRFRSSFD